MPPAASHRHTGLLDLPGELYGEICRHLRHLPATGRHDEDVPNNDYNNDDNEEEEEEEDVGVDSDNDVARLPPPPPPPFCARAHRDVVAFVSCCREVRAARPDVTTATRRRLTVPLSRLSPSPFVVHTDSARSPFFFFAFHHHHHHRAELHDLVALLDCPSSWVGRMLQLLLQLEHSGVGSRLRRLVISIDEEGTRNVVVIPSFPQRTMRTTADMLRRIGVQLRRSAPGLEELYIDERLNLTSSFYDGLFASASSSPPPPRLQVLDIGLGERFPCVSASSSVTSSFARSLRRLALMRGLRPGHGLGVSVLLANAPALAEVRLDCLIPGVNWATCWPPGLRRISIRRVYDCDIGALEALAHCGPSLRHLEFDAFYVHRPVLAITLARVARQLRDGRNARVSAEILAYDGAFYDDDEAAGVAEAGGGEENEDNGEDVGVGIISATDASEEETETETEDVEMAASSVVRRLSEGLMDTLHMLRFEGLVEGGAIRLDRVSIDATTIEHLASCLPDTDTLYVYACPLISRKRGQMRRHGCQRLVDEDDDPLCAAVRRLPCLKSLWFCPARPPTPAQLIDIGVRVSSVAFRAREPSVVASSSSSSSAAAAASASSPPLDIWIWSGGGSKQEQQGGDDILRHDRGVTRAWATEMEARGLPVRTTQHQPHNKDARRGIVRPHLLRRSLPFCPSPPSDADVMFCA